MKYFNSELNSFLVSIDFDRYRQIEVIEELQGNSVDFEVNDYRFIHRDVIDEIQCEELKSDVYMLGCFNAGFLSTILDVDIDVIETLQESEAFEGLGKLILNMGKLEELQAQYSTLDDYGNHFSHYDGDTLDCDKFYVFRLN